MRFVSQLSHSQGLVHLKTNKAEQSALQGKYTLTNIWNTCFTINFSGADVEISENKSSYELDDEGGV